MLRLKFIFLFILLPLTSQANDLELNAPPPLSVEDLHHSLSPQFKDLDFEQTQVADFFKQSKLTLNLRNYYLDRSQNEFNTENTAWAQGGSLAYQSGKYKNILSLKAEYFMAANLYNPDESDESNILTADQESYGILGVLNPRIDLAGNRISLYRQRYNYAYINDQFSRMTPNTFEGYTLSSTPSEDPRSFQYILGYLDKIKLRNSDEFISMSEAAGASDSNIGTVVGGFVYSPLENYSIGLGNFYTADTLNIFYSETQYRHKYSQDLAFNLSAQFSDQRSSGDDLLSGDYYSTHMWGLQNALSYKNFVLKVSFNSNSDGGELLAPFGSYPSYTSSVINDFNRAGEESWKTSLSYNLSKIGYEGVSISTNYTAGNDAINSNNQDNLPDRNEIDLTLDFKPKSGYLKDVWFRIRGAHLNESAGESSKELRLIINYNLDLLEPLP